MSETEHEHTEVKENHEAAPVSEHHDQQIQNSDSGEKKVRIVSVVI